MSVGDVKDSHYVWVPIESLWKQGGLKSKETTKLTANKKCIGNNLTNLRQKGSTGAPETEWRL